MTNTLILTHIRPNCDTLSAAAELIGTGIDFRAVNKRRFFTKTKRRIAMESELLSALEFFAGDRGVFLTVPPSMINRLQLDEGGLDNVSFIGAQIGALTVQSPCANSSPATGKPAPVHRSASTQRRSADLAAASTRKPRGAFDAGGSEETVFNSGFGNVEHEKSVIARLLYWKMRISFVI